VNVAARTALLFPLVLLLAGSGCTETTTGTSVSETPPSVLKPSAPDETKPAPTKAEELSPTAVAPKPEPAKPEAAPSTTEAPKSDPASADAGSPAAAPAGEIRLVPVKFDEMLAQFAAKKAKLTMVDAWATWCGPCKENFPHVVEMNAKYASQGLAVVSLSMDDPEDTKAVAEAKRFLTDKKAVFTNFLLNEDPAAAFEKLNTSVIPAVFLYGPDGKELKRFTMDDPNNQFTYEQVEKTVAAILKGELVPEAKKDSK
jgi:thiol-disulfide isomerase/thioredoxin